MNRKHLQMTARHFVQIGRLLEQGYPIKTALTFIQLHVSTDMKHTISEVLDYLIRGYPIHKAFESFRIPASFKSILYFYEEQGDIAEGFIQAGSLLEQREKMKEELMKLLRYPLLLLWICIFLLLLMYYLVVPHFHTFFSMTNEMPLITKMVFTSLDYTPYIVACTLTICISCIVFFWYKYKVWSPYEKVMKLLSYPIIGKYVPMFITYYFSLQLGRLAEVGLSLQEALYVFKKQDYLPFFQQECNQLMHELHQGHSFSQLVKERDYFKEELSFVVENGEKTGYFAQDLVHYSDMLYREIEESLQKALRYIQPFFFIIIGVVVFVLFLATMLPLFQVVGIL